MTTTTARHRSTPEQASDRWRGVGRAFAAAAVFGGLAAGLAALAVLLGPSAATAVEAFLAAAREQPALGAFAAGIVASLVFWVMVSQP